MMEIQNKYDIGQLVKFGPFAAIITGIRLAGEPFNILYEINFFDSCDSYKIQVVYDFELKSEKTEFGFKPKTTSGEGGQDWKIIKKLKN